MLASWLLHSRFRFSPVDFFPVLQAFFVILCSYGPAGSCASITTHYPAYSSMRALLDYLQLSDVFQFDLRFFVCPAAKLDFRPVFLPFHHRKVTLCHNLHSEVETRFAFYTMYVIPTHISKEIIIRYNLLYRSFCGPDYSSLSAFLWLLIIFPTIFPIRSSNCFIARSIIFVNFLNFDISSPLSTQTFRLLRISLMI